MASWKVQTWKVTKSLGSDILFQLKTSLKGRKKVWSLEQVDPGFKSRLCHHPMAMGKLHNFSDLGFTFYKMGP